MDAKTRRKHLNSYTAAYRDIELTEAAIELLEKVTGTQRVIATLKKSQRRHLARLDAAAEKLGAPYGA
jgi:predicted ArsR family transcriptional regulator